MPCLHVPVRILLLLTLPLAAQEAVRYRQWIDGQELGGAERTLGATECREREWMQIARLGTTLRQEQALTTRRTPSGALTFTWSLTLAQEPLTGEAAWDPKRPLELALKPARGVASVVPVPEGALLWPGALDARYREAAQARAPFKVVTYSFALQQWSTLELQPVGQDPLPGHPETVRFRGQETQGSLIQPLEAWVCPEHGELRQRVNLNGMEVLSQVATLPAPSETGLKENLFAKTLKPIPAHAFLPWLPELDVRQEDGERVVLRTSAECQELPGGAWRLRRAAAPEATEAAQLPVMGTPTAEEAPYLAPSPIVPFQDPVFAGLLRRLNAPAGASRWELARLVTRFVFEWIPEKDYTVGFATALEVAHSPKGDCTEHGVLAVALLRRLGVPARGVVGWVALDQVLGPHFWVEVRVGQRWVPVDPTFSEAPASTFRLKLSDTDLASLGTVGWDSAQLLGPAQWVPTWREPRIEGDRLIAPDGTTLHWPKGRWTWIQGRLVLGTGQGRLELMAITRPWESQLARSRKLRSPGGRQGWWTADRELLVELGPERWLRVLGLSEEGTFPFLQTLHAEVPRP